MIDVKKEMAALPPITGNTFWDSIRFQIRTLAATTPTKEFFDWYPILYTINVGPNPGYLPQEEKYVLETNPMAYYRIQHVKQMFERKVDQRTADTVYANLMHQAAHLFHRNFEIEGTDWVFEFGSGFGIMLLLVQLVYGNELHISTYDLPELQILQKFFLEWVSDVLGIDYSSRVHFETEATGFPNKRAVNLFIACFSLSEVPEATLRHAIIDSHTAHQYLIVYQRNWQEGFNNHQWFNENLVNFSHPYIKERVWLEQTGFLHYNQETVHLTGV